jgi:hypothetical protein
MEMLWSRRLLLKTPEVIGVLTVAVMHLLYFVFNPDVLRGFIAVLQQTSAGYNTYSTSPFSEVHPLEILSILICAVGLIVLARRNHIFQASIPPLMSSIAWVVLAGMISFIIQAKGWSYQAIPMRMAFSMLMLWMIAIGWDGYSKQIRPIPFRITALLIVLLCTILVWRYSLMLTANREWEHWVFVLAPIIEAYTVENDGILVVNSGTISPYPVLPTLNRRSISRYATSHPISFAYYRYEDLPYTDPNHIVPLYAQRYLDDFAADIDRYSPKLLLIRSGRCTAACNTAVTDMHDYLIGRDVIQQVVLPTYNLLEVSGGFHIYVRKDVTPH